MGKLRLTVGKTEDGLLLAVLTDGGHPQVPGSGDCTVLDVQVVKSKAQAKAWAKRMKVERPWETRQ